MISLRTYRHSCWCGGFVEQPPTCESMEDQRIEMQYYHAQRHTCDCMYRESLASPSWTRASKSKCREFRGVGCRLALSLCSCRTTGVSAPCVAENTCETLIECMHTSWARRCSRLFGLCPPCTLLALNPSSDAVSLDDFGDIVLLSFVSCFSSGAKLCGVQRPEKRRAMSVPYQALTTSAMLKNMAEPRRL